MESISALKHVSSAKEAEDKECKRRRLQREDAEEHYNEALKLGVKGSLPAEGMIKIFEDIPLHQKYNPNPWSEIAAHFPGRTDNDIKNMWNTHLKKRLAKEAPEPKQDEASLIKLSSSPSTVESNPNNQKLETESHIELLPQEGSPMKTDETKSPKIAFAPNQSTVANHVTELHKSESFNRLCYISQQSEQLTDSSGTDDVEQFIIWQDPNLLESLLNEVDDPNWVLAPQNTQNESTENTSFHERPMESDIYLRSMFDNDVIPAPAKPDNIKADHVHLVKASMTTKSMNAPYEYINDKDNDSIFQYLENEAGLDQLSMEVCQQPKLQHRDDVNQNRTS
ncbi:hypothetical protein QQ045_016489 [Rhodiola kirilowii]